MTDIVSKNQLEKTVKISKSGAYVKSNDIATIFNKQHKDVLKMIATKISEIEELNEELTGEKFRRLISNYFKETSYLDSKNRNDKFVNIMTI